ncbi:MAG: hypothetical protein ACI8O8_003161 [Oleiphilaceae bacterium]|jgi:uncharacterized protein (TIGR02444 family)
MMKDLSSLQLDNPFWQFSLQQWKNSKLQQQLLSLQDEKAYRINLLLLGMWLSFEHKDIRPHQDNLIAQTSEWHENIVLPLRQVRQALPSELPQQSRSLKTQLQTSELHAEQIEQALLFKACAKIPDSKTIKLDSLDWLVLNLSASHLEKSDLFLLIQNCLPMHPTHRINERLNAI